MKALILSFVTAIFVNMASAEAVVFKCTTQDGMPTVDLKIDLEKQGQPQFKIVLTQGSTLFPS